MQAIYRPPCVGFGQTRALPAWGADTGRQRSGQARQRIKGAPVYELTAPQRTRTGLALCEAQEEIGSRNARPAPTLGQAALFGHLALVPSADPIASFAPSGLGVSARQGGLLVPRSGPTHGSQSRLRHAQVLGRRQQPPIKAPVGAQPPPIRPAPHTRETTPPHGHRPQVGSRSRQPPPVTLPGAIAVARWQTTHRT